MRSEPVLAALFMVLVMNVQGSMSPDTIHPEMELLESSSVVVSSPWVGDGGYAIEMNGTEHKLNFTSTPGAPTPEGLDFGTIEVVTDSVAAPVWAGTGSYAGGNVSIHGMTGYLDNPKGDFSTELKWVKAGNATGDVMTRSEILPQEVVDKLKEEKPPPTAAPTVEQLPASDVVDDILHPSNSSGLDSAISEEFPDGVAKDDHGNEDCGDIPLVSSDASINPENKVSIRPHLLPDDNRIAGGILSPHHLAGLRPWMLSPPHWCWLWPPSPLHSSSNPTPYSSRSVCALWRHPLPGRL